MLKALSSQKVVRGLFGSRSNLARRIVVVSAALSQLSDQRILQMSRQLRSRAVSHAALRAMLVEAFAVVREAARRAHDQAHYENQIIAGIELFDGGIVEMQTGEGKTLAALLPAYLYSLLGHGCHVVTANDYLAQRDAEFAAAVFNRLGITTGCLNESLPRAQRKIEYDADVTYGTAREIGFDFLKDRLAVASHVGAPPNSAAADLRVQRTLFFALVDEADSVMIDDARTPLLIATPAKEDDFRQKMILDCHRISLQLEPCQQFELNRKQRSATLTQAGCLAVLKLCQPRYLRACGNDAIYQQVENSLSANHLFRSDRHYVVNEGEVAIVDESTGRIADGRKWQNGLHQAVEAKAQVAITAGTRTTAKVTIQTMFRSYVHLAGLTGTAAQAAREFKKVYDLTVTAIPVRKPPRRAATADRIFFHYEDKAKAVAIETIHRLIAGQSVLIGTPSVGASQSISKVLTEFEIKHDVLNCLEHERESKIIEQAGRPGRVTVATNMAGRGTDIHVDDAVLRCGGLHIIATEKHSSSRIDRQLIGRTARQGQPGSFQFLLSLDDELFALVDKQPAEHLVHAAQNACPTNDRTSPHSIDHAGIPELPPRWIRVFDRVQAKIERLHEKQRILLLQHEKSRTKLCRQAGLDPCLEFLDE